jgi:hypothetical protein
MKSNFNFRQLICVRKISRSISCCAHTKGASEIVEPEMTDVVIGWEDNKPENYFRQITY